MSSISKLLAQGFMADSDTALYTCPSATQATIKSIIIVNSDSANTSFNLYVKKSAGQNILISPKNLALADGELFGCDNVICLEAGDSLRAESSISDNLHYSIHGFETT